MEDNLQVVEAAQDVPEEVAEASPVAEVAASQGAEAVLATLAVARCSMEDSMEEMGVSKAICPPFSKETTPKATNS